MERHYTTKNISIKNETKTKTMEEIWKEDYDRNTCERFFIGNMGHLKMPYGTFDNFTKGATGEIKRLMGSGYKLPDIISSFKAKYDRTKWYLLVGDNSIIKNELIDFLLSYCALIKLKQIKSNNDYGVIRIEPKLMGITELF